MHNPNYPLTPVGSHVCCHAVGGVIGFALVYGGPKSVIWAGKTKSFPFLTGVVVIVASWFISPLLAGMMSYLLYTILRLSVLRGDNSPRKAIWCLPILLLVTMFISECFHTACGRHKLG
jgi:sodium-dependent phosphate transporter